MFPTDSLLTFSFPIGRLLGVPLRLSFLMPVVVVALMWRVQDFVFGLVSGATVLLTLFFYQVGHLLASRKLRHHPGVVVIWPLGAMSSSRANLTFREATVVALAGPFLSASLAIVLGWHLQHSNELAGLLNPFAQIDLKGTGDLGHSCVRVAFFANYCLALFNLLIPVRPLACGHVAASFLNLRFLEMETQDLMLRIGLVLSLFGVFSGFVFDISSLVALSTFLLVLHIHEATRWFQPPAEPEEESFLGYDFSEGYTSLSRSQDEVPGDEEEPDETAGILERWKSRREEEKERREMEERMMEEEQLDLILEKLHQRGRDALSSRELNLLNRVSARLRQKNVQDHI